MSIRSILFAVIWILPLIVHAQNPQSDSSKQGGFGSPDQIEKQMEKDNEPKASFFELGFIQPYFDFKARLKENTGFGYGLDYSAAYFGASQSLGEKHAASGMVRLYGSWELVGRGSENTGALNFKVEHRHKYSQIPLSDLGFELGYVGMILPPFNNNNFRLTNFYWRQRFAEGRISLMVGLLDATDYLDVYALASPWMHFSNFAFSTGSEVMYIPNDAGLGIAVGAYITEHIYAIAGITDAGADPTHPLKSFETFFSNNDYFTSVEVGWVSKKSRYFFDNVHVTYWHSDGTEVTASPPGWGLSFSGTYFIKDKFLPFLRGGYAKDGGTLLQKSLNVGVGYQAKSGGSLLGFALGWGQPNENSFGSDLKNQGTFEVFYRVQVSSRFDITPDLQFLVNPALNTNVSSIFMWGIRSRLVL